MAEKKNPFFVPQEMQPAEVVAPVVSAPVAAHVEKPAVSAPYLPVVTLDRLPSKGIPYPVGTTISYHPYTFGELKKFGQSKLTLKQRYEFILEGILVSGMPKEKITFNDFLFVSLLRKISSIGVHEVLVKFPCFDCGHENNHGIKLDELDFDELGVPELPATVTIKGQDMSFTPLTLEDLFALIRDGKDKDPTGVLAVQCRTHPFQVAYDLLYGANPEDSEVLEELNKVFYHGLAPMKLKCQNTAKTVKDFEDGIEIEKVVHCDVTNHIDLGDPSLIVQPFRRDGQPAANRIRFGAGAPSKSA